MNTNTGIPHADHRGQWGAEFEGDAEGAEAVLTRRGVEAARAASGMAAPSTVTTVTAASTWVDDLVEVAVALDRGDALVVVGVEGLDLPPGREFGESRR